MLSPDAQSHRSGKPPERIRPLLLGSRRREKALKLRTQGDKARDERRWNDAAQAYRAYLKLNPKDFGFWVQLGHALKELGELRPAAAAYEEARMLDPGNADLHLNIGHLFKMEGRYEKAARAYIESAASGANGYALHELALPEMAEHLDEPDRRVIRASMRRLVEPLRSHCDGLRPLTGSDLAVLPNGDLELLSHDPWINYELDVAVPDRGQVGELSIHFGGGTASRASCVRLYIDYGKGFSEIDSINLPIGAGPTKLLLAAPSRIRAVRFDPDDQPGRSPPPTLGFRPITTSEAFQAAITDIRGDSNEEDGVAALADIVFESDQDDLQDPLLLTRLLCRSGTERSFDYFHWRQRYATLSSEDYRQIADMVDALPIKPGFSFVMPTYDTPPKLLRECLDSLLAQTYPDFEICIADDCSPSPHVVTILEEYARRYPNVRFVRRSRNGHISSASNSALALATKDFIVLVDHDDLIPDYALATVAYYINKNPAAKVLYSDEDKINLDGVLFDPYFKSDFNKFLLYGHNMISHLGVYERELMLKVGGFRRGLEGSQDYDLALRAYEEVGDAGIVHIPHILYHWRAIPGSTAVAPDQKSYAVVAAQQAINCHFERTKTPLRSVMGFAPGVTDIVPDHELVTPLTIIIPTRDGLDLLEPCIASIDAHANDNVDILIVDNGSTRPETLAYLQRIGQRSDVTILPHPQPFNYSEINNIAVQHAKGELICFLNNDTEVIAGNWIDRARGLLALPEIGAVGARLLYKDRTIQHFGIYLGMADHRVATLPHGGLDAEEPGYFGKARLLQEFSAATAACLFMRKADFERVGGFDPTLRVAYNDVDLCLRIRQAGLKIVCDPGIELYHKESKTRGRDVSGESAERLDMEAALMRERWADILDHDPYYSPNLGLDRNDFALAYPPRVDFPWRTAEVAAAPSRSATVNA